MTNRRPGARAYALAMSFPQALVAGVALLVVATLVGFLLRARPARRAVASGALPLDELGLTVPPAARALVVQFSTQYCARCPGVRRGLDAELGGDPRVGLDHVDLTDAPELAARLRILQTPTVAIARSDGTVLTRLSGAVAPAQVRRDVDALISSDAKETSHG